MNNNQKALLAISVFSVAYLIAVNLGIFLKWRDSFISGFILRGDRIDLRNKLLAEEGLLNGRSISTAE
jgi:hypothetical protein